MPAWFKKHKSEIHNPPPVHHHYPHADVDLEQMKRAVREYEKHLPHGVKRSVLIQEHNRIDAEMLAPYLKAIPNHPYYMSRHTYEIFTDEERQIPYYLDMVQQAVDEYISEHKKIPVWEDDPYRRVNYTLLMESFFLKEKPPIDMYLTGDENLITHRKRE